ncbi:hypothetical protein [Streptomyces zhihengii]
MGRASMAKGYKCPVCGTNTVQRTSTNKLQCSKCKSRYDKSIFGL